MKRVAFESSFLEQLYNVSLSNLYSEVTHRFEFAPNGLLTRTWDVSGSTDSWRTKASAVASPYIFLACFKMLDMYVENLLYRRGFRPKGHYRFDYKSGNLKVVQFDNWIEVRPWLKERIISLYCELEDYRHAIAHRWAYEAQPSGVLFVNTRGKLRKQMSQDELASLARIVCCLTRVRLRIMKIHHLQEVKLLQDMNAISGLHNKPILPASEFAVVTYNSTHVRPTVDLIDTIQAELKKALNVPEVRFDLVFRACEGTENAETYFFDWEAIYRRRYLSKSLTKFAMKA